MILVFKSVTFRIIYFTRKIYSFGDIKKATVYY